MIIPLSLVLICAPAWSGETALTQLQAAAAGASPITVAVPATVAVAAPGAAAAPSLPDEFTIHERVLSLMDTFDLKAGGNKFGKITEKFFSMTKSFTYEDASGVCVAKARSRILSWGTHVDVTDCADRPLGAIKEQVMKSFFKVYTIYSILGPDGRQTAVSEKVEWISTDVVLRRADGRTIAELHRPWLNFLSDNWEVKIRDHQAVDARLLVMIAAYKTSVDNDRRREARRKSDDGK